MASAFAAGCVVSVLLWRFWTPQCNESCPKGVAPAMVAFAVAFPLACLGAGAAIARLRAAPTRWIVVIAFVTAAAALIALLTQAAQAG
ncbi:MAG TPA: hypothetical protein VGP22_13500 [Albitalea sp.]|nr:hypothetical protein [Albitalea sp.]